MATAKNSKNTIPTKYVSVYPIEEKRKYRVFYSEVLGGNYLVEKVLGMFESSKEANDYAVRTAIKRGAISLTWEGRDTIRTSE